MRIQQKHWFILGVLSLIWGSSFILMKKALLGLTPVQVGTMRILITAIVLIAIGYKGLRLINTKQWWYIFLTAMLGTFFPVFLFAFAIAHIDSAIGSILNATTPLNTLLIGALFFGLQFKNQQVIGILIGLAGTISLIYKGATMHVDQNYYFALLPLTAALGYAFNVNIIKRHLSELPALTITTGNFILLFIPALLLLWTSNFFTSFTFQPAQTKALIYVSILAVLGTALAKTLFNKLIQMTSPIFSTSVTYLIPIVAIFWGTLDGENLTIQQLLSAACILIGVYITNRK